MQLSPNLALTAVMIQLLLTRSGFITY